MNDHDAKKFLDKNNVRYVLAQFVDIHGVAKTKAVPVQHFKSIIEEGAGFAGFAVWGLNMEPHDADFMAKGDLNTLSLVPWQPGYARIVCNGYVNEKPYPLCTRNVLQKQLDRLQERGWTLNTGLEPEFSLLKHSPSGLVPHDDTDALDKPCYDYKGLARSSAFLDDFVKSLRQVGFDVYQIDHEDGNGQFEINYKYTDAMRSSDNFVFCRMAGAEIARSHGLICTFMPKPASQRTGSGMHIHLSISDQEKQNIFFDKSDSNNLGLSQTAYYFLGGLLCHAKALAPLCAPSVNSYKRLVVGGSLSGATWAPAYISYGDNNRTAMVRIPYGRLEFRLPDSSCNPYLATAAMIVAGLDGIDRKLDPGAPTNLNHYRMTPEELTEHGIDYLPQNLNDAIRCLESEPLFEKELGGIVKEFIKLKKMEWIEYAKHVSDWEINRYLEFY